MIIELSQEQKDRLFKRLIVSASDILAEEFGLPKRTFDELQELFEKPIEQEENLIDLFPESESEPI